MACCIAPQEQVTWESFVVDVAAFVKDAPTEMIAFHAREAAIEFANQTRFLRKRIFLDLQENVNDYCLEADDGYTILSIVGINSTVTGKPLPFSVYASNHILLQQPPSCDVEGGAEAIVSVVPGRTSCNVDKRLYDLYAKPIASAVISRLMRMPEAPWYNTREWRAFDTEFRRAVNAAKVQVDRNFVEGPVFIAKRRFI